MKNYSIYVKKSLLLIIKSSLLLLLLTSGNGLKGQGIECGMPDLSLNPSSNPPACLQFIKELPKIGCDNFSKYSPVVAEYTPIRKVRIVVHVIQQNEGSPDGPRNFENTPEHIEIIDEVISHLNWLYTGLIPLSNQVADCPSPYTEDTRLRFIRDSPVLFHANSDFWDKANQTNCDVYDFYVTNNNNPEDFPPGSELKDNAMHIFIEGCSRINGELVFKNKGYAAGIPVIDKKFVVISNVFYNYFEYNHPFGYGYAMGTAGRLLSHELGHALGLFHHNNQDAFDCCDTYNFGDTNNMMDGYPYSARALSQCQLARINYFLEGKDKCGLNGDCTDLYKTVITDYCNKDETYDIIIPSGPPVVWEVDKKLTTDIIIKTGGQLTIKCKIGLPTDANIIVERGARLFVDGGTITHNKTMWDKCDEGQWGRIYVMGNFEAPHFPGMISPTYPLFPDGPGFVILHDATLEYARHAISTRSPYTSDFAYHGGLIYASKSYFLNNHRSIEFRTYKHPNSSTFISCEFEDTDPTDDELSNVGISNWSTQGVRVVDCRFIDLKERGVSTFDASMEIIRSTFNGIERAISCSNSLGNTAFVQIGQDSQPTSANVFENNYVGVYASNMNKLFVNQNVFIDNTLGICINGLSGYQIKQNEFFNSSAAIDLEQTGGMTYTKTIECNTYNGDFFGINARGDNSNMFFTQQDFDNSYDVHYWDIAGTPGILSNQKGLNIDQPAVWNYFTQGNSNEFHINSTGNTQTFKYFHPSTFIDPDPSIIPKCDLNSTCIIPNDFENIPSLGEFTDCNLGETPPGGPIYKKERLAEIEALITILTGAAGNEIALEQLVIEKEQVFWGLIAQYNDEGDFMELRNLLLSEDSKPAKRYLIGYTLTTADFNNVNALLAAYPIDNIDDQNFITVQAINLKRSIAGGDFILSEVDETALHDIVASQTPSAVYAQGLLTFLTGEMFRPVLPDFTQNLNSQVDANALAENTGTNKNAKHNTAKSNGAIHVFPNPAKEQLEIGWHLIEKEGNTHLKIYTLYGKLLYSEVNPANPMLLNTEKIGKGLFLLVLEQEGIIKQSQKFVVL